MCSRRMDVPAAFLEGNDEKKEKTSAAFRSHAKREVLGKVLFPSGKQASLEPLSQRGQQKKQGGDSLPITTEPS